MKIYYFQPAPNPAKLMFYLKEKQITDIDCVLVDLTQGEHRQPAHLQRSPRGTLPVLELDDGTCIAESLPIMEYLEELYPEPSLIGTSPRERLRIRALERYLEMNVLLRVIRLVHATRSPLGLPPNPAIAERENAFLPSALAYVDSLLSGEFVAGERPSIADCTLLAAVNFGRFGGLDITEDHPALRRWFDSYALRHV
ncbi:MAG: glutathione S-transferase family protein [Pseudomonadota bacterium]